MNAIPQQTYVVDREVNPFYSGRSPIMGWQIPICQKERSSLNEICLTAFAESEFGNPFHKGRSQLMGWQILSLPKRTQFFKKSMPYGICRIGIRQPRFFRYRLLIGNEIKRKRWVDEDVNHPEERHLVVPLATRQFLYYAVFSNDRG